MAAGDITVTSVCAVGDSAAIVTALSGAAVVADEIVAIPMANGLEVKFAIIKAA